MATSTPAGSAKSLSESRAEALQALLDSLAPGAEAAGGEKLKPDQVRRISDKLGELLGEDVMPDTSQRNEKGELLNEEGLPIIDIVEPVHTADGPSVPPPATSASHDIDVIPLWALSSAEKARRRAERERILDLLEEEERVQQEKDEEEERERFKIELEQRKKAAEVEMDALKKAREMQKKMGKALLRNLAQARDRQEKEQRELEDAENKAREERKKLKPKKSVTFADLPPDHEYQPANSVPMPPAFDWGDVSPATLQPGGKTTPLTRAQMDKGPMRMNVIERVPGKIPRGPKSPPPPTQPDSDDESEPGSAASDESGEVVLAQNAAADDDAPPPSSHDDSEESDYGIPQDNEPIEWDVEGYDFAQHQREVALEYYEKRATVGAEALAAMRNHDHGEDEWDRPVVPLEANLASSPPKPSVSRFRAERTSSLPSSSLGASILPASQSSTLKSAVRLGKLEDDNLVGGEDGESEDELDPASQEVLEMLKKGELVNVGPSLPSGSADSPRSGTTSAEDPRSSGDANTSPPENDITLAPKPKPSKVSQFKMSLGEPATPRSPLSPGSSLSTPITTTARSSPKIPSGTPIAVPTKTYKGLGPSQGPSKSSVQIPGMIVDSPSFPVPGNIASGNPSSSAAFQSVVIESPSFHSPSSTVVGTPGTVSPSPSPLAPTPTASPASTPLSASVLERRPVVATQVRESTTVTTRSAESTPVERKKTSRFLASRS